MSVKEITTFDCGRYRVQVTGDQLVMLPVAISDPNNMPVIGLTRAEARDLSKALSAAADIVRSPRKRKVQS